MGTLYRLKAYFGMVPAEDFEDYADYDEEPGQVSERVATQRVDQDDRDYRSSWEEHRNSARNFASARARLSDREPITAVAGAGAAVRATRVHGALAVDPVAEESRFNQVTPTLPDPRPSERPSGGRASLSKIVTLQPLSYNEARTIGERYRDGAPVIMNLTELDDASAKRLVDFAAGLAFALRGSIDKVTSRVFLLSPPDVEVSAEDARRLAERGFLGQD